MGKLFKNTGIKNIESNFIPDDILLSEFIGGVKIDDNTYDFTNTPLPIGHCSIDFLMFDKSWDWLMEVCKKWDNLYNGVSVLNYDYETYVDLSDLLDDFVTLYEIDRVYTQIVKNIKWYKKKWLKIKWNKNFAAKCLLS